ncbi:thioredoxin-like protein [Pavlovales sp. CCMP2436]|nr:thioredoxin-like protein [Pavlovales sp. CCMP2436]|mmetsp:Transcript_7081/g.18506  ORF Transcript_7081/g.18506 Transcript_7081/m.18506 type:complete len:202 (+) Transcript_7081:23-628(+)
MPRVLLPLFVVLARVGSCDGSIFDFTALNAAKQEVSLREFRAPVTLVVNTASECGFTSHYKGLQELFERFGGDLQILAFPCNQFGQQEPKGDEAVQAFVKSSYGVTFPVLGKVEVNGASAHPLFSYLKEKTDGAVAPAPWAKSGPGQERDVQWNFSKFLCDSEGVPIKRYDFSVEPSALVPDIEAAIKAAYIRAAGRKAEL